jgi:hypothetical protein
MDAESPAKKDLMVKPQKKLVKETPSKSVNESIKDCIAFGWDTPKTRKYLMNTL